MSVMAMALRRQMASGTRASRVSLSYLAQHGASTEAPLVERYRSAWAERTLNAPADATNHQKLTRGLSGGSVVQELPARQIPDDLIRVSIRNSLEHGSSMIYAHLQGHPGDMKVIVRVDIGALGLTPLEKTIVARLGGLRYNPGKQELKLTIRNFPNRVENKKFGIYQAETIVAEAKRLAALSSQYALPETA